MAAMESGRTQYNLLVDATDEAIRANETALSLRGFKHVKKKTV